MGVVRTLSDPKGNGGVVSRGLRSRPKRRREGTEKNGTRKKGGRGEEGGKEEKREEEQEERGYNGRVGPLRYVQRPSSPVDGP